MPGPAPSKHPSTLRRQGRVPFGTRTYDPSPVKAKRLPAAPPSGWHPRSVTAWRSVVTQGWVRLWSETEWQVAEEWLLMHSRWMHALDDAATTPSSLKAIASEVRALLDQVGGTEQARRRERWLPSQDYAPEPRRGRLATVTTLTGGDGGQPMSDEQLAAVWDAIDAGGQ